MKTFPLVLAILAAVAFCKASDLQQFAWSSDSSSDESDTEAAGTSSTKAKKWIRPDLLWYNKQSERTKLESFRPDAALVEAGGLRKLISQDSLLSLRSPNFVIWLQHKGREALRKGAAGEQELEHLMVGRVRWADLEDARKSIEAKYIASVGKDLTTNEGVSSLGTIVLKTRLQLLGKAGEPPTEHEPQIFRLTPDQSSSALGLVDKFEQFAKDSAAKMIRPR